MIKIDGCESAIYPDGSVRINIADGGYLCLDYSDIKFLYNEMTMKLELKRTFSTPDKGFLTNFLLRLWGCKHFITNPQCF
jgi:hypothetical protein